MSIAYSFAVSGIFAPFFCTIAVSKLIVQDFNLTSLGFFWIGLDEVELVFLKGVPLVEMV